MKRSKKKNTIPTSNTNVAVAYYNDYGIVNLVVLLALLVYTFIK